MSERVIKTPSVMSPQSVLSRRAMLQASGCGFGYLAFAALAAEQAQADNGQSRLTARPSHFAARAKRVIFLCMKGGPSHVDLFDHKPELSKLSGKLTTIGRAKRRARLLGSPFKFARHGKSGLPISELFPHLSKRADELCVINSMHTDLPNHSQAFIQMHTGSFQFVRPSIGAWLLYGLGSINQNLPGFITISPPSDNGGARNYGSAFLPTACQGTKIGNNQIPEFYAKILGKREETGPVFKNIDSDQTREQQRRQLDLIGLLDRRKLAQDKRNPAIEGAIESFELAFRMQDEVPRIVDLGKESKATLDLYGIGGGRPSDRFGRQCLMARRLVEAGVRFVEVTSPTGWDHHFRVKEELEKSCAATDHAIAGLLSDLKQRGLLKDTLVVWAGEFGRTPYGQSGSGRDHNNKGYSIWMAGGGVKGGYVHGATDEFGYEAVEKPVHTHDWHATLLHLMGINHKKLTFNYAGRDFRLTDVYGDVVKDIMT